MMYILLPALENLDGAMVMARVFAKKSTAITMQDKMESKGIHVTIHSIHRVNDLGAPINYAGV